MKKSNLLTSSLFSAFALLILVAVSAAQSTDSPTVVSADSQAPFDTNPHRPQKSGFASSGHASPVTVILTRTVNLPVMFNPPKLLFADDFSNPNSGWPIDDDGVIRRTYIGGEYEIMMRNTGWWAGAIAPIRGFSDYTLSAKMRRQVGSASDIGLVFDFVDWNNFYVFAIDPGVPWFGLLKVANGSAAALVPISPSSSIFLGNATNLLRVVRDGDRIDLIINDQQVSTLNNPGFAGNIGVGFYTESDSDVPAVIRYDDIKVRELGLSSTSVAPLMPSSWDLPSGEGSHFGVND